MVYSLPSWGSMLEWVSMAQRNPMWQFILVVHCTGSGTKEETYFLADLWKGSPCPPEWVALCSYRHKEFWGETGLLSSFPFTPSCWLPPPFTDTRVQIHWPSKAPKRRLAFQESSRNIAPVLGCRNNGTHCLPNRYWALLIDGHCWTTQPASHISV